jgi:hypothetical protein
MLGLEYVQNVKNRITVMAFTSVKHPTYLDLSSFKGYTAIAVKNLMPSYHVSLFPMPGYWM